MIDTPIILSTKLNVGTPKLQDIYMSKIKNIGCRSNEDIVEISQSLARINNPSLNIRFYVNVYKIYKSANYNIQNVDLRNNITELKFGFDSDISDHSILVNGIRYLRYIQK